MKPPSYVINRPRGSVGDVINNVIQALELLHGHGNYTVACVTAGNSSRYLSSRLKGLNFNVQVDCSAEVVVVRFSTSNTNSFARVIYLSTNGPDNV